MDFRALPSGTFTLDNVTVPACLIGQAGDLITTSLTIADGRIATDRSDTVVDTRGAMVLPGFVDMHTHLDKGHIWPRASNPDGTFMGALTTVGADRLANWSAEDVAARMEFSLRCAYAHGTRAIRTHLDSLPPQDAISFPVFRQMREAWKGRIELQASCLVAIDKVFRTGEFAKTAQIVAESGGVLGAVTYPVPDLRERLLDFFALAQEYDLHVDFHVDETEDPKSDTLRTVAEVVLQTGFARPVTVGHCCSLARMDDETAETVIDLVAAADLNVVSLPMCNMYLQDRHAGRTPRWRGVTMVHELAAARVNVSFASDNTRDPFYAYGDLDMVEVLREATRICHLDHARGDWVQSVFANPARACGFEAPSLLPGAPADLTLFRARSWTEFFARPQSDRIVMGGGQAIDRRLPDYSELDPLMS